MLPQNPLVCLLRKAVRRKTGNSAKSTLTVKFSCERDGQRSVARDMISNKAKYNSRSDIVIPRCLWLK